MIKCPLRCLSQYIFTYVCTYIHSPILSLHLHRKVANGLVEQNLYMLSLAEGEDCPSVPGKSIQFRMPPSLSSVIVSTEDDTLSVSPVAVLTYNTNPLEDMFTIGRAANGGNDFVVPGILHVDKEGCTAGPVSRWACRIVCERLPPFRLFVYAGGFDPTHQVKGPFK